VNKTEGARVVKDPDNHFPYKREDALQAGIPAELVDAAEAVVKAQQAYYEDPSDENLEARRDAERHAAEVSGRGRGAAPAVTADSNGQVSE
jgi:hypothetical protein